MLLLNHNGTESLLFTNHNRRKIMQMSYAELAGLIANGTVRSSRRRRSRSNGTGRCCRARGEHGVELHETRCISELLSKNGKM